MLYDMADTAPETPAETPADSTTPDAPADPPAPSSPTVETPAADVPVNEAPAADETPASAPIKKSTKAKSVEETPVEVTTDAIPEPADEIKPDSDARPVAESEPAVAGDGEVVVTSAEGVEFVVPVGRDGVSPITPDNPPQNAVIDR